MDIINLGYLFLFIPLIFSGINILQNYKLTNTCISVGVVSFILMLSFYMMPEILPNIVLQNNINNDILFLIGEFRIDFSNLFFIILIFFVKLILFMFFDEDSINTKKLNFFFAIYLVNYFATCGILTSNNIFNIYIYTELYSFSLYNLMSDYKKINYTKVAYKYYNNGVLGSIFFMFSIFIVYFTFGTSNIDLISKNLSMVSNDYVYNSSVFLFLAAIFLKFFSFHFYYSGISKTSQIANLLFINILFSDIILGIYLIYKLMFSLYDINTIFNVFAVDYIFYIIGSLIIIYNSYKLYVRKNLLPMIYSFSLIMLGYALILFALNNQYGFVSIFSLLINHTFVDLLFYIMIALLIYVFNKSDIAFLYSLYKYRYIVYCIVLSKIGFPIGFGFNSMWNYILSVISSEKYFLFIPFLMEKISIIMLFNKYYFVFYKKVRKDRVYLSLEKEISLKTNYMLAIILIFFLIVLISFFEGAISSILFDFFESRSVL